jgi:hypothetical protein
MKNRMTEQLTAKSLRESSETRSVVGYHQHLRLKQTGSQQLIAKVKRYRGQQK